MLFTSLLVALFMSMASAAASALRSLSLNNGGTRVFSYSANYTFDEPGGGFRVTCDVLRVILFNRDAIPKIARTLIATAEVRVSNCRGGTVRILEPRGWGVLYIGIMGTLPNITGILLQIDPEHERVRSGFLLEVFFGVARCLYGNPVGGEAVVTAGEIRSIRAEEAPNRVTTNLGGASCPEGILRGTLVPDNGSPAIRIRLI